MKKGDVKAKYGKVTHTWNLSSTFNPSKLVHCTHINTAKAVGSHFCCGNQGAIGGLVPCTSVH